MAFGYLKSVIVTPPVFPRFEFHHFGVGFEGLGYKLLGC